MINKINFFFIPEGKKQILFTFSLKNEKCVNYFFKNFKRNFGVDTITKRNLTLNKTKKLKATDTKKFKESLDLFYFLQNSPFHYSALSSVASSSFSSSCNINSKQNRLSYAVVEHTKVSDKQKKTIKLNKQKNNIKVFCGATIFLAFFISVGVSAAFIAIQIDKNKNFRDFFNQKFPTIVSFTDKEILPILSSMNIYSPSYYFSLSSTNVSDNNSENKLNTFPLSISNSFVASSIDYEKQETKDCAESAQFFSDSSLSKKETAINESAMFEEGKDSKTSKKMSNEIEKSSEERLLHDCLDESSDENNIKLSCNKNEKAMNFQEDYDVIQHKINKNDKCEVTELPKKFVEKEPNKTSDEYKQEEAENKMITSTLNKEKDQTEETKEEKYDISLEESLEENIKEEKMFINFPVEEYAEEEFQKCKDLTKEELLEKLRDKHVKFYEQKKKNLINLVNALSNQKEELLYKFNKIKKFEMKNRISELKQKFNEDNKRNEQALLESYEKRLNDIKYEYNHMRENDKNEIEMKFLQEREQEMLENLAEIARIKGKLASIEYGFNKEKELRENLFKFIQVFSFLNVFDLQVQNKIPLKENCLNLQNLTLSDSFCSTILSSMKESCFNATENERILTESEIKENFQKKLPHCYRAAFLKNEDVGLFKHLLANIFSLLYIPQKFSVELPIAMHQSSFGKSDSLRHNLSLLSATDYYVKKGNFFEALKCTERMDGFCRKEIRNLEREMLLSLCFSQNIKLLKNRLVCMHAKHLTATP